MTYLLNLTNSVKHTLMSSKDFMFCFLNNINIFCRIKFFFSSLSEGISNISESVRLSAFDILWKERIEVLTLARSISLIYVGCIPVNSARTSCDNLRSFLNNCILLPIFTRTRLPFILPPFLSHYTEDISKYHRGLGRNSLTSWDIDYIILGKGGIMKYLLYLIVFLMIGCATIIRGT